MIALARQETAPEWRQASGNDTATSAAPQQPDDFRSSPVEPKRVRYFYYTAGSGGVGTTILETSFLLAGTDVIVYVDGKEVSAGLWHNCMVLAARSGVLMPSFWQSPILVHLHIISPVARFKPWLLVLPVLMRLLSYCQ